MIYRREVSKVKSTISWANESNEVKKATSERALRATTAISEL